ncbi:isochorismatase family protein [Phytohabitans sp. ZYX-F-186]|uniref:isochorismatase n=1 Tax=Phytohabitans maris TaxID=3071409 RepID=A0ABU0Z938_9ACTN|nr:isochorismatase family protein [Phytohabitans sp. ZYX-F-186]MDQ7903570.1 isochorismatase family protein [Phytohabitans sp. ZYX-F-186]
MSLPAPADYPPPSTSELPVSRAPWELSGGRAALLVHDMQRYFARVYRPGSAALERAVSSIASLLHAARRHGVPVVYTAQSGDQDPAERGLQADLWGPGLRADPTDTEILAPLAPRPGELVLAKHRYSAFARTDLARWLADQGRDQLVITGVYAQYGVLATALDAFCRDIAPFVVADAVAAFDRPGHLRALEQAADSCAVVTTAAAVRAALALPRQPPGAPEPGGADEVLRGALAELLDGDEEVEAALAEPDRDLFALGLDSVRAMALLAALEERGVAVDFGDFIGAGTVGFLRERIAATPGAAPPG